MFTYFSWINNTHACIFIICSIVICAQSDVPRPRGVSLSKAPLYAASKDFTCFDGTLTIPFGFVNDDYCDCFDGSDEPGTAACLNGVFHCTNAGHRPQNIPSSRVNDGVCDCCDGTDEYATQEGCPNICEELGKEARYEAQRTAELHKAGNSYRLELIEKGNKKRSEMGEQLAQLEKDKAEAEKIKAEKETLKNELEAKENDALKVYREAEELERQKKAEEEKEQMIKEATEFFSKYDKDNDGTLTKEEMKEVSLFDRGNDGEVDEDDFKYFINDNENVDKETFVSTTWSMVKPLQMMQQNTFKPPPVDDDDEHEPEPDEEPYDVSKEVANEDTETEDDNIEVDPHDDAEELEEVDEEPVQKSTYDEETQKLINEATEARREYTDAERTVREIEANMRSIQDNLEKDYGLQQEYATLDGQCLEFEDKEYVYKLCLFQKVTQKSKNGGGEVGLGNWGEWAGTDNNKYSAMRYTNGVSCWNGPQRTTTIAIQCGLETQLLSVSEPYRCEYKMEISIPAACDELSLPQHSSHDEL